MSILDQAFAAFSSYGPSGMLIGLLLVVFVDAIVIPLGPELLAIAIFSTNMDLGWAILIISVVAIAQVGGTTLLYLVGKHTNLLPKYVKKVMVKYKSALFIKDEKIVFVNCFVPVLPFLGAFMAVSKWNYAKSMSFVVLGGVIKYSLFLGLSQSFHYLFASGIAQKVSLLTVLCLLVASGLYAFKKRKAFGTDKVAAK
jgi:membrane protein YqaA with SNARE-associated domain